MSDFLTGPAFLREVVDKCSNVLSLDYDHHIDILEERDDGSIVIRLVDEAFEDSEVNNSAVLRIIGDYETGGEKHTLLGLKFPGSTERIFNAVPHTLGAILYC